MVDKSCLSHMTSGHDNDSSNVSKASIVARDSGSDEARGHDSDCCNVSEASVRKIVSRDSESDEALACDVICDCVRRLAAGPSR